MVAAILRQPAAPIAAGMVYQPGIRCARCWGTNWLLGRTTAECGGCGAPVVLATMEARRG